MRPKHWLLGVCLCVLALALIDPLSWAPAHASRLGQTVPTRTPSPTALTPTAELLTPTALTPTAEPPTPTAQPTTSTAEPSKSKPGAPALTAPPTPALLPIAGASADAVPGALADAGWLILVAGCAAMALAWRMRRRRAK